MTIPNPIHGGKDPDGMNAKRTAWGAIIARTQRFHTCVDHEDAVCDAIANLLHHACAIGQDPADELARAVRNFNAETGDG